MAPRVLERTSTSEVPAAALAAANRRTVTRASASVTTPTVLRQAPGIVPTVTLS